VAKLAGINVKYMQNFKWGSLFKNVDLEVWGENRKKEMKVEFIEIGYEDQRQMELTQYFICWQALILPVLKLWICHCKFILVICVL
jgi:hypothetical protein